MIIHFGTPGDCSYSYLARSCHWQSTDILSFGSYRTICVILKTALQILSGYRQYTNHTCPYLRDIVRYKGIGFQLTRVEGPAEHYLSFWAEEKCRRHFDTWESHSLTSSLHPNSSSWILDVWCQVHSNLWRAPIQFREYFSIKLRDDLTDLWS